MAFGNTKTISPKIEKAGKYKLSTAKRGVQHAKGKYVLVPLASEKGEEYAVSAGESVTGVAYDTLSITARTLGICTPDLERLEKAKMANKESVLEGLCVKLAKSIAKHFEKGVEVQLEYAKKDGKIIVGKDGKKRLNFK